MAQAELETGDKQGELVWRAAPMQRAVATGGAILLLLLAWRVVSAYGFKATIAGLLALGVCAFLWWGLLRPKLSAGPGGVEVVLGPKPVHVAWKDIRRVDAGTSGIKITVSGGTEVTSRWPQRDRGAKPGVITEADRVASYLARRADWARKPTGAMPTYEPLPPEPSQPKAKK